MKHYLSSNLSHNEMKRLCKFIIPIRDKITEFFFLFFLFTIKLKKKNTFCTSFTQMSLFGSINFDNSVFLLQQVLINKNDLFFYIELFVNNNNFHKCTRFNILRPTGTTHHLQLTLFRPFHLMNSE